MHIGIDFDNTLICYDGVFKSVGLDFGLVPESLGTGKQDVRAYLRGRDREEEWTRLQGIVYGTALERACLYPGVMEFLDYCRGRGISCSIISHKTRYPYVGEPYDLRAAARNWLENRAIDLPLFFEDSQDEKQIRIRSLGCTHFIDDLPEFLALGGFSRTVNTILFDPRDALGSVSGHWQRLCSWGDILEYFNGW